MLFDLRKMNSTAVALAMLLNMSATALAHAGDLFQKGATEIGVSVGLGDNFHTSSLGGNVEEDIEFLSLMFSWAKVFKERDRGRSFQFAVEGFVSHAEQEGESRRVVGAIPFFVYNFKNAGKIIAFAEAGLGLVYTDLDPERFGSRFNFTLQAGIGFRYRLSHKRFFRFSYRFHHISNAGLDEDNRGIDSNFLIFGISLLR